MLRTLRSIAAAALLAFATLPACLETSPDIAQESEDVTQSNARFETFTGDDGQRYFQLVAGSGELLLRSEGYTSASALKNGITSIQKNGVQQARFDFKTVATGEHYVNLKAANGQIIGTGDLHLTKAAAQSAVDAVIAAVAKATTVQTQPGEPRFELVTGKDGKTFLRLRAANGQIVLETQGYSSKSNAKKGIAAVESNGADAARYQIVAGAGGQHAFRIVATNGKVVGRGEVCSSEAEAKQAAERAREIIRALAGAGGDSDAAVHAAIQEAADGVWYTSESDYPFQLVSAQISAGTAITEALVRTKLASVVDNDPAADKPLSSLVSMERTWESWKAAGVNCYDPDDPDAAELCEKTKNLEQVLEANLTDIHVYYFGAHGQPGNVTGIGVSIFIVGRTASGNLAGVRTLAIWT